MESETLKILEEQLKKLPLAVVDFLSSSPWNSDLDEIGSLYNLTDEEMIAYKREAVLVLSGIVHPDAFIETLEKEAGIKGSVLEALVLNVEKKIFAPIRPTLIKFFEEESVKNNEGGTNSENVNETLKENVTIPAAEPSPEEKTETFNSPFSAIIQPTPVRTWEKAPEIIPDNLPTEETTQSFLPNLTPKTTKVEDIPAPVVAAEPEGHPFEEKMKKVFTAGQQSMGDLTIEQATETRKTPPVYHTDPYREPIE